MRIALPRFLFIGLSLYGLAAGMVGCRSHSTGVTSSGSGTAVVPKPPPIQIPGTAEAIKADLTQTDAKGQVVWELKSPEAEITPSTRKGELKTVDGTLYENGQPSVEIKSPGALVDDDLKTLTLTKGVTVTSLSQGEQFTADQVVWQWEKGYGLEATGHVQFQRGAARMTGGKLVADVGLRRGRLTEQPQIVAPASGV